MKRIAAAIALIALLVAAGAHAQLTMMNIGGGDLGASTLTPCASTGIYNLSNVCNDIYFIGALK